MHAGRIGDPAGAAVLIQQAGRTQVDGDVERRSGHQPVGGAAGVPDRAVVGPGAVGGGQDVGVVAGMPLHVGAVLLLQQGDVPGHRAGDVAVGVDVDVALRVLIPAIDVGHHGPDALVLELAVRLEALAGVEPVDDAGQDVRAAAVVVRMRQAHAVPELVNQGVEAVAADLQPLGVPAPVGEVKLAQSRIFLFRRVELAQQNAGPLGRVADQGEVAAVRIQRLMEDDIDDGFELGQRQSDGGLGLGGPVEQVRMIGRAAEQVLDDQPAGVVGLAGLDGDAAPVDGVQHIEGRRGGRLVAGHSFARRQRGVFSQVHV